MAQISSSNDGGGKKVKQKKVELRVDFTPMVDMNMLLITFFMFCTTLSKPQTMEISMPDKTATKDEQTKVLPDRVITIVLAGEDKVYYYEGEPNYEDYTSLKETDYTENGLRKVLLRRNAAVVKQIEELKVKKRDKLITDEEFEKQAKEIKDSKTAPVVVIKAKDESSYKNMIDALDEMLICNVSKYAIVDITDIEDFLLKNLLSKGNAAVDAPKR